VGTLGIFDSRLDPLRQSGGSYPTTRDGATRWPQRDVRRTHAIREIIEHLSYGCPLTDSLFVRAGFLRHWERWWSRRQTGANLLPPARYMIRPMSDLDWRAQVCRLNG
jgi:hypothetical protein